MSQIAVLLSGMHKIPLSEILPLSAVFLKLILVIYFNHKFLYAFKASYERLRLPRIALGDALYLASSLINHGCDANMYHVLYGTHVVYRARRPINKGEQLTDCYVVSAAKAPYRERQNQCMQLQKFQCK
jgi:SET domain